MSPETVEVRARVSGYIDKVHFKEGSDVKQDDLLITLDQRQYQAVVDRVKAELGAARARGELARGEANFLKHGAPPFALAIELATRKINGSLKPRTPALGKSDFPHLHCFHGLAIDVN